MSEQIIGRLLPEWLSSNKHRSYPLDDTANGNGLPTAFLVDALFINSSNIDNAKLFINKVVIVGDNVHIGMSGYVDSELTDFGTVCIIPFDTKSGTNIPIFKFEEQYKLAGTFVVGDVKSLENVSSVIKLDENSGRLFPGCVRKEEDMVLGIKVGDVIYSGVVTLEAGEGISFNVITNNRDETTIQINCKEFEIPIQNLDIIGDEDLLGRLLSNFGPPVRTICGVSPDDNGNIDFAAPSASEEGKFIKARSVGEGAVALDIPDEEGELNCNDRTPQLDALAQNISILNERAAAIDESIVALDSAQSNLAIRVAKV